MQQVTALYGHCQCLMSRMVIHDHHDDDHGWGERPGNYDQPDQLNDLKLRTPLLFVFLARCSLSE